MYLDLYEGAVGPTVLASAQAEARLDASQQLSFSADLAPAEAGRHSGHVRVRGSLPLRPGVALPLCTWFVFGSSNHFPAFLCTHLHVQCCNAP